MAGVFLVTLSVSTAFGAAPAGTRDATRGQTIAALVHELIVGTDETDDPSEEPVEEDELVDDDQPIVEELIEEEDELTDEEDEEADAHGACVSAAAQDREGSAESELKNHGKWVSQHARYTCWGLDVPTDEVDEGDDEETSDVDAASAESDDEEDAPAAKANGGEGKPSWAGAGNGGNGKPSWAGNDGNGRGGGRR